MNKIALAALALICTSSLAQTQNFSSEDLARRTIERRAVEAAIWGMPLVNTDAMRQAYFRDVGAKYNDICYFSKPQDWKFQVTTPRPRRARACRGPPTQAWSPTAATTR
jgi:hypothetical protein